MEKSQGYDDMISCATSSLSQHLVMGRLGHEQFLFSFLLFSDFIGILFSFSFLFFVDDEEARDIAVT